MFIPGWTSSEASYHERAKALTNFGYICLAITLRGHGESSGKLKNFSRTDHLNDVIAAYDFLAAQKNVDPNIISVVGASYGAYLGAVLSGKRNVKHLALRAPAIYNNTAMTTPTIQLISGREDDFLKNFRPEPENLALEGIKKIKGELLIIESEKDQTIPSSIVLLYKQAATTPVTHKIIHFSDHQLSQGEWKQQFIDILASFFAKLA